MSEVAAGRFARSWSARVLPAPPMIAPARAFVWPRLVAGEEDALARGALTVEVRPAHGAMFLLTCALGFADPAMPSGVFGCPDPDQMCVVAGGYAYVSPVAEPERCVHLAMRPVVSVHAAEDAGLLLFAGFQTVLAWGREGVAWQTGRLSWEGLRVISVSAGEMRGLGWDMMADQEREFVIDLATGSHRGGGYRVRS